MPNTPRRPQRSFDDIVSGRSTPAPTRRSIRSEQTTSGRRTEDRRGEAPKKFWNYPRRGKGPIHRWVPSWRFVLVSVLGAGLAGIGLFLAAYTMLDVPVPEDVATAQTTTVYYADGETEMGQFATVRRTIIDTSELPDHVGQAIVASEDRRFYSNVGVDPIGIARAFINNIMGGQRQGGSTITQQYVERYYTGENFGYRGKAKEAILALKIDRQQSKEQILGNYMNTIYFGRGANGIEQAAIEFFGKPAKELTLSEAALLSGIIPAPSAWDPEVSPDIAQQRWARTLDLMVTSEFITQAERDAQEFPQTIPPGGQETFEGPQGHLLRMVRNELLHRVGLEDDDIDSGGYDVVTTIDRRLQHNAVDSAEHLPEDRPDGLRVGLISLDNETGGILAAYGGPDYLENSFNNATQGRAQAGSTFKVFTLLAGLEQGLNLADTFPSPGFLQVTPDWPVQNYDHRDRGWINLITATQYSVNTTYALLNQEVGAEATMEMAIRLGMPEDTLGLTPDLANVLGSASPTALENANAFSTIATGGKRLTPHIIAKVESAAGAKIYSGPEGSEQVLDAQVAADATYAMTKVVEGGTASTANVLGRPAAGKTGSSSLYKSAWFVGYVPQITTAVVMYQEDAEGNEVPITPFGGYTEIAGGTWPTTIWTEFMLDAVADLPVEQFPDHSPLIPTKAPEPSRDPEEDVDEGQEDEEGQDSTPEPEPDPEQSSDPESELDPEQGPEQEPGQDPEDEPGTGPGTEPEGDEG